MNFYNLSIVFLIAVLVSLSNLVGNNQGGYLSFSSLKFLRFLLWFYLYILRGPQNHLYVGVTHDISKRIARHKNGDGAEFTKRNKTYELVYQENFSSYFEARKPH